MDIYIHDLFYFSFTAMFVFDAIIDTHGPLLSMLNDLKMFERFEFLS